MAKKMVHSEAAKTVTVKDLAYYNVWPYFCRDPKCGERLLQGIFKAGLTGYAG